MLCNYFNNIGGIDENGEIRTDARGAIQIDINKLVNRFQEIISDDVDAITIRKALEIKEDGLPIMPLSYPVIKGKLEKILASMLSKQVINKYLPGSMLLFELIYLLQVMS